MERVFFEEKQVRVTDSRFVVRGQTYAMRNITLVKSSVEETGCLSTALAVLGCLVLLTSILFFGTAIFSLLEGYNTPLTGWLIAIVLLAAGSGLLVAARKIAQSTAYTIVLQTSSGEVTAIQDSDKDFIERIIEALNQAIVAVK